MSHPVLSSAIFVRFGTGGRSLPGPPERHYRANQYVAFTRKTLLGRPKIPLVSRLVRKRHRNAQRMIMGTERVEVAGDTCRRRQT